MTLPMTPHQITVRKERIMFEAAAIVQYTLSESYLTVVAAAQLIIKNVKVLEADNKELDRQWEEKKRKEQL